VIQATAPLLAGTTRALHQRGKRGKPWKKNSSDIPSPEKRDVQK